MKGGMEQNAIETYLLRREPRQRHVQSMEALDAAGLARSGVHMPETFDEVMADLLQDHPIPEISLQIRHRSFRANIPPLRRSCNTSLTSCRLKTPGSKAQRVFFEFGVVRGLCTLNYAAIYVRQRRFSLPGVN